jgi:Zn-dependent metalloprotease
MKSTPHVGCIQPPHILINLAEHPEHRQRALRALAITERLRGRREVFAEFAAGLSAGQKRRTVYDAKNRTDVPGTLVRGEGDPASADVAVNEAYDFSGTSYDFYQTAYNRNSVDGRGLYRPL